MTMPLITIGITCYNEGDWLLECWESVLSQTSDQWTAVLVMDGTTHQRTREIFEELEHPKLRKYAMPSNMGPYPTGNKAFELSQGPYHFWIAGDDQLLPNSVALMLDTFARYPDAGFVYGDYETFGAIQEICNYPHEVTADDLIEFQCLPGACAYQKTLWERLGGFSVELARGNADYDFFIGALEAGVTGRHCGEVFYRYRVGHSSVSGSYKKNLHETNEIMVRRHPRFFYNRARRNRFLALGYKEAAWANYAAGEVQRASELAWSAVRHGMWQDRGLYSLVLRGMLPASGFHAVQHAWRLGRHAVRALPEARLRRRRQ